MVFKLELHSMVFIFLTFTSPQYQVEPVPFHLLQDLPKENKISEPEPPKVTQGTETKETDKGTETKETDKGTETKETEGTETKETEGTETKETDKGNKPKTSRSLKRAFTAIHHERTKPNKDSKVEASTAAVMAPNADVADLMTCEASWWGAVQPQQQSLVIGYWKF